MTNIKEKDTSAEVPTEIVAQESPIVKTEADIDGFIKLRQDFIAKVNAICIEGKDYHVIQGKKSLAKGGAEKIASIFRWTTKFDKDTEALEMLGDIKGLVALKCTLMNGQYVGEGRGAASLLKNGGDANKTLKMAQKSAFIDAVLRASGLSDFFTQDLEDMPREQITQPQKERGNEIAQGAYALKTQATPKQKDFIIKLCAQKGIIKSQLKEISVIYNNPSKLIAHLISLPAKTELPSIQIEDIPTIDPIADKLTY